MGTFFLRRIFSHLEICTQLPPWDQASSSSQKCNRHKNKEKWWLVKKKCNMCTFRQCTNIGQTTDGTPIIPTIRIHQHFHTQSTKNIPISSENYKPFYTNLHWYFHWQNDIINLLHEIVLIFRRWFSVSAFVLPVETSYRYVLSVQMKIHNLRKSYLKIRLPRV